MPCSPKFVLVNRKRQEYFCLNVLFLLLKKDKTPAWPKIKEYLAQLREKCLKRKALLNDLLVINFISILRNYFFFDRALLIIVFSMDITSIL